MTGTLDDRYFEWLYGQIAAVRNRNPARSYWKLARQLYIREFVWFVPNDDNRVEDGRDLRLEFLADQDPDEVDPTWMDLGCSVLEMLVALSRRASFEADDKAPSEWFWHLLENIHIRQYNDKNYSRDVENKIDEIIDRVVYRSYTASGKGGLFPLRSTTTDQRKVELWYQMSAYLLEGG